MDIPDAYVFCDGGYLWLTCNACDRPIVEITAGDNLLGLVIAAIKHTCPS